MTEEPAFQMTEEERAGLRFYLGWPGETLPSKEVTDSLLERALLERWVVSQDPPVHAFQATIKGYHLSGIPGMTDPLKSPLWAEKVETDDIALQLNNVRRETILEMKALVEGISSARDNPDHQGGIRWAQARMLHYLSEMENAIP